MLSKVLVGGLTVLAAFGGADAFSAGSTLPTRAAPRASACSLRMQEEATDGLNQRRAVIGGLFGAMLAGTAMTPTEAEAARSGGRVGGGFKRAPTSRSAPSKTATSATTVVNRPTTVIVQPTPVYGGYGGGFGYGGFGSPLSPGMWVGLGAIELAETFAREQRRQEFMRQQLETQRKLGQDQAAIESLEKQVAQQNQMLMEMQRKLPPQ